MYLLHHLNGVGIGYYGGGSGVTPAPKPIVPTLLVSTGGGSGVTPAPHAAATSVPISACGGGGIPLVTPPVASPFPTVPAPIDPITAQLLEQVKALASSLQSVQNDMKEMEKAKKDDDREVEGEEAGETADAMLDPNLYDPEFLAKVKRAADAGLSHASSTSELVATEQAEGSYRRKDPEQVAYRY